MLRELMRLALKILLTEMIKISVKGIAKGIAVILDEQKNMDEIIEEIDIEDEERKDKK